MPQYGTFNLHASLLPDYRGAAPINWAIINGETKTGVTTFFIDEKISNTDKANIWLLTSNNKIVWVAGLRIDDRFKVTPATKTVLKITFAS